MTLLEGESGRLQAGLLAMVLLACLCSGALFSFFPLMFAAGWACERGRRVVRSPVFWVCITTAIPVALAARALVLFALVVWGSS